ncbi:hypothetical protein [Haloferax sp. DFSO52]|uniref:hypothetical protein n=1 Tax=Haloferax sp. DFSO52 TaxID=3388505 RepID=UPI003A87DE61
MNRRTVITALGTLTFGTGIALGTGAADVVSSNNQGGFRVVSPGADIRIDPADSVGSNVVKNGTIDFDSLEPDDLPVATVSENNGQMVTIQVAITGDQDVDFGNILKITNNNTDGTDYTISFDYTEFGSAVEDGSIPKADVVGAFEFQRADGTVISSDPLDTEYDPTNAVTVSPGTPETVSLSVTQSSSIANGVTSGSFTGDSDSTELINEVTAMATQQ